MSETNGEGPVTVDLVSHFECPVCSDHALPPIFQCDAGHLICKTCKPKVAICPTCRGPYDKGTRAFALEKMAEALQFPCQFKGSGCSIALSISDKPGHEETCHFRPYVCPTSTLSNCTWRGLSGQVKAHLINKHHAKLTERLSFHLFDATDSVKASFWLWILSCLDQNFCVYLERRAFEGQGFFFASVRLIGDDEEAEQYSYRLSLSNDEHRLSFESSMQSIRVGASFAADGSLGLLFNMSTAKKSLNEYGKLLIRCHIVKNEPEESFQVAPRKTPKKVLGKKTPVKKPAVKKPSVKKATTVTKKTEAATKKGNESESAAEAGPASRTRSNRAEI